MGEERGSEPILPSDDFRARRDYLPDDAFLTFITGAGSVGS
jgi:hypothetical protein